jgi:hypothetical protein
LKGPGSLTLLCFELPIRQLPPAGGGNVNARRRTGFGEGQSPESSGDDLLLCLDVINCSSRH